MSTKRTTLSLFFCLAYLCARQATQASDNCIEAATNIAYPCRVDDRQRLVFGYAKRYTSQYIPNYLLRMIALFSSPIYKGLQFDYASTLLPWLRCEPFLGPRIVANYHYLGLLEDSYTQYVGDFYYLTFRKNFKTQKVAVQFHHLLQKKTLPTKVVLDKFENYLACFLENHPDRPIICAARTGELYAIMNGVSATKVITTKHKKVINFLFAQESNACWVGYLNNKADNVLKYKNFTNHIASYQIVQSQFMKAYEFLLPQDGILFGPVELQPAKEFVVLHAVAPNQAFMLCYRVSTTNKWQLLKYPLNLAFGSLLDIKQLLGYDKKALLCTSSGLYLWSNTHSKRSVLVKVPFRFEKGRNNNNPTIFEEYKLLMPNYLFIKVKNYGLSFWQLDKVQVIYIPKEKQSNGLNLRNNKEKLVCDRSIQHNSINSKKDENKITKSTSLVVAHFLCKTCWPYHYLKCDFHVTPDFCLLYRLSEKVRNCTSDNVSVEVDLLTYQSCKIIQTGTSKSSEGLLDVLSFYNMVSR